GDPAWYQEQGLPPHAPAKLYYSVFPRSRLEQMNAVLAELGIENPWQEEGEGPDDIFWRPDDEVTATIDVSGHGAAKRPALDADRTQFGAEDWMARLPDDAYARIWGIECYHRAGSRVPVPNREDDLFAGLRTRHEA